MSEAGQDKHINSRLKHKSGGDGAWQKRDRRKAIMAQRGGLSRSNSSKQLIRLARWLGAAGWTFEVYLARWRYRKVFHKHTRDLQVTCMSECLEGVSRSGRVGQALFLTTGTFSEELTRGFDLLAQQALWVS